MSEGTASPWVHPTAPAWLLAMGTRSQTKAHASHHVTGSLLAKETEAERRKP